MQRKSKHSKFKNAGILFELLTRQITSDILSGRDESFTKNLMFKYFQEGKELGKEVQLYNFLAKQNNKDSSSADRILSVVLQTRSKLNERSLNKQKYDLIKEIKEKYNIEEFLKNKIPNYKLYASIYKLFEDASNKEDIKFNLEELMSARECIIENITKEKKSQETTLDNYEKQSIDVRLIAYKFLIESFNKKYNDLLPDQKKLLKEYITNISNSNKFTQYVKEEYKRIIDILSSKKDSIKSDVIKIKINEIISQFSSKKFSVNVKENQLISLLNSYELINELNKINENDSERKD